MSNEESYFGLYHRPNALIFNLCIGYLVSVIFWFMVVFLPECQRRRILRKNLATQYQSFRRGVVDILLTASIGSHDTKQTDSLTNYKAFKAFFSENRSEKWYAALNELQANESLFNELLVEIEILIDEVVYILNNVNINDGEIFAFFKNLSGYMYRLKNSRIYTDDPIKYLGNFVWGILAQWSIIEGQQQEDIIQRMIDQTDFCKTLRAEDKCSVWRYIEA